MKFVYSRAVQPTNPLPQPEYFYLAKFLNCCENFNMLFSMSA